MTRINNSHHQDVPVSVGLGGGGGGGGGGGLFSSIKGGAGSFLKNLKDTSSKVMQTMQQSIARTDLDISAITSRILVMPCPSEGLESAYKTNSIDDIRLYVESRFAPAKISVYNLGSRTCPRLPPPIRTIEGSFLYPLQMRAPLLSGMYSLVEDMYGFLSADPKSVIFVQSADGGKGTAAMIVSNAALLNLNFHSPSTFVSDLRLTYIRQPSGGTGRCHANFCRQTIATEFTAIGTALSVLHGGFGAVNAALSTLQTRYADVNYMQSGSPNDPRPRRLQSFRGGVVQ